jgi:flagellin
VNGPAPANSAQIDVGGASETSDLTFTPIVNGSDQQTITIAAPDNNGSQQSLSITLQNNGTARNGQDIDQAISAINTALQQSNNATLKQVVAVKDNSSGTQQIRFMSTLNSFQVSLGNTGDGSGMASSGAQGVTVNSARAAGGSTADISTLSSAEAAVNALANSVTVLGSAQAVVGRGENQFNYAVNLANSQLTNFSAAESTIRDADLATESANLTKAQILLQAGIAALAQANSAPQQVLSLLQHG